MEGPTRSTRRACAGVFVDSALAGGVHLRD
ncbi:DUF3649 domain-containing protein [Mycolicibacterium bacteremicum]